MKLTDITYRTATDSESSSWDDFVDSHPRRTFAHRWHWSSVLEYSYRIKPYYIFAEKDGAIIGVLPTVLMRSRLFGRFMISLPWLDYGGPLALSDKAAIGMVDFASSIARSEKCRFLELRAVSQIHPGLVNRNHKYSFILDLTPGEENVWNDIDGKCRNQVRKAVKSGLEVRFGGVELLNEFYIVFARNMRDLGTPVWPRSLFAKQFEYFSNDTELAVVYLSSSPVAAALLIHYDDYSTVPSASSYRQYLKLSPNNILYWEIIRHCIARGSHRFDFGRSSPEAGTYKFKKQWVKDPELQTWQYNLLSISELPELSPSSPKFRLAIGAWKRLPLPLANLLGPHIATKLP